VEPSHADELLTQALKQSLALVDIKVFDPFVVAGTADFVQRPLQAGRILSLAVEVHAGVTFSTPSGGAL